MMLRIMKVQFDAWLGSTRPVKPRASDAARMFGGWPMLWVGVVIVCNLSFAKTVWSNPVGYVTTVQSDPSDLVFDSREEQFIAGLLQRRLYGVAESHCLEMFERVSNASGPAATKDQSALMVALIQIRTSMALNAATGGVDGSDEAWEAVWDVESDFQRQYSNHPGRVLVSVQTGLAYLNRAQRVSSAIKAEVVTGQDRDTANEQVLEYCRSAKQIFSNLEREIDRLLPERRDTSKASGELGFKQLLALKNNVRYQIAVTQLLVASIYRDGDDVAHRSSINDVLKKLQEVQGSVLPSENIWWWVKINQIKCYLGLNQVAEAERILSTIPVVDAPGSVLPLLLEQQLLFAIARGDQKNIQTYVDQSNDSSSPTRSPQLELVRIEAVVALAKLSRSEEQRSRWLNEAAQMKREIEVAHGAWWGRRAGLTLIQAFGKPNLESSLGAQGAAGPAAQAGPGDASIEILVQTALQSQRNGNLADAVKAYDHAIGQAQTVAPGRVLDLQIGASQIMEQQNLRQQAAERLALASAESPKHPKAPAAHLRGTWNMAQWKAGQQSSTQPLLAQWLIEKWNQHIQLWPNSATKDTAALWLLAEHVQLQQPKPALAAFEAIDLHSSSFPEALLLVRNLFFETWKTAQRSPIGTQRSIADAQRLGKTIVDRLQAKVDGLRPTENSTNELANASISALVAQCAETLIEIQLESESGGVRQLKDWTGELIRKFKTPESNDVAYRHLLAWDSLLSVLHDADAENAADTQSAMRQLVQSKPDQRMCQKLFRMVSKYEMAEQTDFDDQPSQLARDLQEFGLEIIQIVNRLPLTIAQRNRWDFQWGKMLRKAGRGKEAIGTLQSLSQRFGNDLQIQLEFARVLTKDESRRSDALRVWRRLAKRLTPGNEHWLEAKYNIANQLRLAGDDQAAKKLLLYTRSVYGWKQSRWRNKFETLLRVLQSGR